MDQEYGHIVYTRRGTGRNLDGKIANKPGLGIHSLSSNLQTGNQDESLIKVVLDEKRIPSRVFDRETYTYFVPSIGMPMLGHYRNRTVDEIDEAARTSKNIDIRDPFISEWITGDLIHHPFRYIDSPFFQADNKPIAYYYQEEPAPIEDPIPAQNVALGPVTREKAISFAQQGRQDIVKAAVWALIRQFELPPAQRKFIAVRDTETNVRLWIAAITCAFPLSLARQISFETCVNPEKRKIGNKTDITYSIQKTTGRKVNINLQDPNQEQRLFFMIAGVDPNEYKAQAPTSAVALANQPYMLIDGITMQTQIAPDQLIQRAFFQDLVNNDKSIHGFCSSMEQMKDIQFSESLCDLYDAQQIILNESSWNYKSIVNALECMNPHFTNDSVLMKYMLDALCVKKVYLQRFAQADESNDMKLFGILRQMAVRFHDQNAADALQGIVRDRFYQLLGDKTSGKSLDNYRQQIKRWDEALYKRIITEMVMSDRLSIVNSSQIATASRDYMNSLLAVTGDALQDNARGWGYFFQQPEYALVSEALMKRCISDPDLTGTMLQNLRGDSTAIDSFIVQGSKLVGNSNDSIRWWRTLLENHVSLEDLCKIVRDNNGDPALLEDLFCVELHKSGYSSTLRDLYNRYVSLTPGTGKKFFPEVHKTFKGKRGQNNAYRQILAELSSNTNYSDLFISELRSMDQEVLLTDDADMDELAFIVTEYAVRARVACPHAMLRNFLNKMISERLSQWDRDGVAGLYQRVNSGRYQFRAPGDLFDQPKGKAFLQRMEEYYEQPACHVILLTAFQFSNENDYELYMEKYAESVCQRTIKQKNNSLAAMLYLRACVQANKSAGQSTALLLEKADLPGIARKADRFLRIAQMCLNGIRTDRIASRLIESARKAFDRQTADELQKMLEDAQKEYNQNNKENGIGKFFGGLFKR